MPAYGVVVGVVFAALLSAGSSQAKMLTVGPALPLAVEEGIIFGCDTCVLTNLGPANGSPDVSPVDGVILRWHLYEARPYTNFRLRVLTRQGQEYVGAGRSAPGTPVLEGPVATFPADLRVEAGQLIGLELESEESSIHRGTASGAEPVLLEPAIADGEVGTPPSWWSEVGWGRETVFPFNAEILPSPEITGVSSIQGPPSGGNQVTITGENFAEVTGVSFGSTEAGYTVDSESQITATVPAGSAASSVPVSVVTAAGRAEATSDYGYEPLKLSAPAPAPAPALGCVVPKLKGRRLEAVRHILSRDSCRLGRVRKRRHVTANSGRVKKQRPSAGVTLPPGAGVEVTLGTTR
jgi:IPT/TIG domain